MSVYLFVSHLCSVYFYRTARERRHLEGSILLRWVIWHVTFYFACQRATLYVIHYSRSPAMTNLMHGQVPATIPKLLWPTLLSICIHPNGWDHYLLLTKHWPSGRGLIVRELCTLTHAEQFSIVCCSCTCDTCSFFSKILAPKRESCGKWDDYLGERE